MYIRLAYFKMFVLCYFLIFTCTCLTKINLLTPPFESKIDHKYLNVVTVFSLSSPCCRAYFFVISGIVVIVIARHVRCVCPADSQSMSFELVSPYLQFSLYCCLSSFAQD